MAYGTRHRAVPPTSEAMVSDRLTSETRISVVVKMVALARRAAMTPSFWSRGQAWRSVARKQKFPCHLSYPKTLN